MLNSLVTVLDGNLSADACVSDVHFRWGSETHRRTCAKIKAGSGERWMTYNLGL
jgi:hypothetical protein